MISRGIESNSPTVLSLPEMIKEIKQRPYETLHFPLSFQVVKEPIVYWTPVTSKFLNDC